MTKLLSKLTLVIIIMLIIAFPTFAEPKTQDVEYAAYCKLLYNYDQRDGMITCEQGRNVYSFFIHTSAKRKRQLPRNLEIMVVYVTKDEFSPKFWKRVYFWKPKHTRLLDSIK